MRIFFAKTAVDNSIRLIFQTLFRIIRTHSRGFVRGFGDCFTQASSFLCAIAELFQYSVWTPAFPKHDAGQC